MPQPSQVMHLLEREDKKALERVGNRPVCILNSMGREMKVCYHLKINIGLKAPNPSQAQY